MIPIGNSEIDIVVVNSDDDDNNNGDKNNREYIQLSISRTVKGPTNLFATSRARIIE